jgi:hypothetical protein
MDAILGGSLPPRLCLPIRSLLRGFREAEGSSAGLFGRGRAEEATEAMGRAAQACRAIADHASRVRAALAPLAAGLAGKLEGLERPAGNAAPPPEAADAADGARLYAAAAGRLLETPLLTPEGAVDDRSLAALREAEVSSLSGGKADGADASA